MTQKRWKITLIITLCVSIGFSLLVFVYHDFLSIVNNILLFTPKNTIEFNSDIGRDLKVEIYAEDLLLPTSMTFVNNSTLLVTEKNEGNVRLISDGLTMKKPLINIPNIVNDEERGLLGIASTSNDSIITDSLDRHSNKSLKSNFTFYIPSLTENKDQSNNKKNYRIYLYYTEKNYVEKNKNQINDHTNFTIHNRVYGYLWNGTGVLSDPKLLLDIPATPGPYHNGGKIIVDDKGKLILIIGDLTSVNSVFQNYPNNTHVNLDSKPVISSVIIRFNPSEQHFTLSNISLLYDFNESNLFSNESYLYAYGIRNSFGIDIDPISGILWDTENGEDSYDEINLVEPGFNSGWYKIMGPANRNNMTTTNDLIMINGSYYSDPNFSWKIPIGVTDIEFFNSNNFGKDYLNGVFVGDINNGNIYFFHLNEKRTDIDLERSLRKSHNYSGLLDLVVDNKYENEEIIFAKGFEGRITDIETGPDGNLYVLTYFDGKVYKISPR